METKYIKKIKQKRKTRKIHLKKKCKQQSQRNERSCVVPVGAGVMLKYFLFTKQLINYSKQNPNGNNCRSRSENIEFKPRKY